MKVKYKGNEVTCEIATFSYKPEIYFMSSYTLYNSLALEPTINRVEAYLPPIVSS